MKKIVSLLLTAIILLSILPSCASKEKLPEVEQIQAICELATLECYYNNVAKSVKPAGSGWKFLEKERKYWVEYEGVARIGVDMSYVTMEIAEDNVTITIPHAELFDMGVVSESFTNAAAVSSADSFFDKNPITLEDQQSAIANAQAKMEETVLANKALFVRAENRAKDLIESYVNQIGKLSGKEYTITWKMIDAEEKKDAE